MLCDIATRVNLDAVETWRSRVLADPSDMNKANLGAYSSNVHNLHSAVRYWLDVRQMEALQAADFKLQEFPNFVHDNLFVEFSGSLHFNFVPWVRRWQAIDLSDVAPLSPNDRPDSVGTDYRGVHIFVYRSGARKPWEGNIPDEETCARVMWYEKPQNLVSGGYEHTYLDDYSMTMTESSWPGIWAHTAKMIDKDDERHPGEKAHAMRLFRMTVNLLYFLAAENIVRVRIKPETLQRHGKELGGLPKSDRPYHVLPFQLPRYRYLHGATKKTGRGVSVAFSVRGHIRHLNAQCYQRNPDGTVRTVWIGQHERGLGHPYKPTVRVGAISNLFLDYDQFIRQEEQRAANRPGALH